MDRLSDYDYHLPPELIAQTPLADRAASRLLWLHRNSGAIEHRMFRDCPDILQAGDVLVLNDTRVSALRLFGRKATGGRIEALLLREVAVGEYEALVKPGRGLRIGVEIDFDDLRAVVTGETVEGGRVLRFVPRPDLRERLLEIGETPLPPYIHSQISDPERYQTIYSRRQGSAAAPTAGLHFEDETLDRIRAKGVDVTTVTLHVGIDTFRPVQAEDLSEHRMHGEMCEISKEAAKTINSCSGRVVAVGTTSVRTLETFAVQKGEVRSGSEQSTLFIRPGYQFSIVNGMFTNMHLPKTTMLMMISALAGKETIFRAYSEAVDRRYRFLSFGDSMLIL